MNGDSQSGQTHIHTSDASSLVPTGCTPSGMSQPCRLQCCIQTAQEETPASTKRWGLELKFPLWFNLVSCKSLPALTTCLASGDRRSLLGLCLVAFYWKDWVLPLPCLYVLALQSWWRVVTAMRRELWSVKASLAELGCESSLSGTYLRRRDWQWFWRQYTPGLLHFQALSGIWLFYL